MENPEYITDRYMKDIEGCGF